MFIQAFEVRRFQPISAAGSDDNLQTEKCKWHKHESKRNGNTQAIILAKGLQSIIWPNGSQPAVIKIYVFLGICPDIGGLDIYKSPQSGSQIHRKYA